MSILWTVDSTDIIDLSVLRTQGFDRSVHTNLFPTLIYARDGVVLLNK